MPPHPDKMDPFYDWFDHGAERALAITLPVLLEELLEQILRLSFRPDKQITAEFFRPTGPLGNFGAKTRMAYMMNLMDENTYRDLLIISKIRNRFAHHIELKSFDDPTVREWIRPMDCYKQLRLIALTEVPEDNPDYRIKFSLKFIMTQNTTETIYAFRECIRFLAMLMQAYIDSKIAAISEKKNQNAPESSP
jgi:DNA-binding MltR family transcriptional regulator